MKPNIINNINQNFWLLVLCPFPTFDLRWSNLQISPPPPIKMNKRKKIKETLETSSERKKALNLKSNWKIKYEEKWAETVIKNSRWEWAWDPWADEDRLPSYVTNKNMQQWPIYYQCENFPTSDVIDIILQHLPLKDLVKTNILSKKWRYKWVSVQLEFTDNFLKCNNPEYHRYCYESSFERVIWLELILLSH